jgi:methylmalonyl-CoA/ethylmalonyl-CoA epimerase
MLTEFQFHHIGFAVQSIELTSQYYLNSGYIMTPKIFDSVQQVFICFLKKNGNPTIELIEPIAESSPVTEILKKNGVAPYHICYEVNNINEAIIKLQTQNFILVGNPVNAVALENRKICFLYNKDIGLVELVNSN